MKKVRYLSIASLVFLMCSGIYGILIGIHDTNEYFYLSENLREEAGTAMTAGTLMFEYFTGAFRGIVTLACGFIGLINIRKGDIKAGYYAFLCILTLLYVLGLKEFPYVEEFIQMLAALFCLIMVSICFFANRFHRVRE